MLGGDRATYDPALKIGVTSVTAGTSGSAAADSSPGKLLPEVDELVVKVNPVVVGSGVVVLRYRAG